MQFPSISEVARQLRNKKTWIEPGMTDEDGEVGVDVRLQVRQDGDWSLLSGDAQFDQDHRGYWGVGFLTPRTNTRDLARDLIAEAREHAALCG